MKKRFSRVYLEITNICNRSCSFCPGTAREPRMISTEEFGRAVTALHPYTDYVYLHVMGEPLCHPELSENRGPSLRSSSYNHIFASIYYSSESVHQQRL